MDCSYWAFSIDLVIVLFQGIIIQNSYKTKMGNSSDELFPILTIWSP